MQLFRRGKIINKASPFLNKETQLIFLIYFLRLLLNHFTDTLHHAHGGPSIKQEVRKDFPNTKLTVLLSARLRSVKELEKTVTQEAYHNITSLGELESFFVNASQPGGFSRRSSHVCRQHHRIYKKDSRRVDLCVRTVTIKWSMAFVQSVFLLISTPNHLFWIQEKL